MKFGLVNISTGGFFSNFFVSISTSMYASNNGLIPYIVLDNTVFAKYGDLDSKNTWEWWFEQETPKECDIVINVEQNTDKFINFPAPFSDISIYWDRFEIKESKKFFDKFFKIKNNILEQYIEYYNLYMSKKVNLGIMARGTEFNFIHPQYGNQNVYTYINEAKNIIKKHPEIDNIFLVTEDGDWVKIFEKEFNNILYMDVFRRTHQSIDYCQRNWLWVYEYNSRENHTKILGDECITQALLLGRCDYLLCKQNSFSAGAIFFNEDIKKVYYI